MRAANLFDAPKHALFIDGEVSFKLVQAQDPESYPLFESDDADEVLGFAAEHGIIIHTLDA